MCVVRYTELTETVPKKLPRYESGEDLEFNESPPGVVRDPFIFIIPLDSL